MRVIGAGMRSLAPDFADRLDVIALARPKLVLYIFMYLKVEASRAPHSDFKLVRPRSGIDDYSTALDPEALRRL